MSIIITAHAVLRLRERAPEIPESYYGKVAQLAYKQVGHSVDNYFNQMYAERKEISSAFYHQHQGSTSRACVFGKYVYIFIEDNSDVYLATMFPIPEKKVISVNNYKIIFRG